MKIIFHKNFEKQYKKFPDKTKQKVKERNILFGKDPYDPILNNHALNGKYMGYRSISITGDIRIIYKFLDKDTALFSEIGTHSDLYS
ncbi:MAG: Plasmid stabilization system [Parcubacteria group bacterium GW2011_GWA1_40_21]|nr:MAG: Plasmid stabilization system [Parcubacteria group bacterium GW2011_GWC1_40_13]KKR53640.1 MAG: Plasmid stabilization system [Parcubacteria group bacterium GW2011_GWA1_40_21]